LRQTSRTKRKSGNSCFPNHALTFHLITILALTVALALHSAAQELARRLILKDGSYQSITKYEVKGDRRLLQRRREEWEETSFLAGGLGRLRKNREGPGLCAPIPEGRCHSTRKPTQNAKPKRPIFRKVAPACTCRTLWSVSAGQFRRASRSSTTAAG